MSDVKLKPMRNEKGVKDNVKRLLDHYNWFWFMPPANAYGRSGISDFIAIWQGCFLAIETKFGANKPTPPQLAFLESIRAAQGTALVVNDKNIEWLAAYLESFQIAAEAAANKQPVPEEHGARMINALAALM